MLARAPRCLAALLLALPIAACTASSDLSAQPAKPPVRRGTPAQIQVARASFTEGVDNISRNPSAFFQRVLPGTGCNVSVSATRPEKADSLRETHVFDAGQLTTKSRMSILASGGVIQLAFGTVDGATHVQRERRLIVGGVAGQPLAERVGDLAVLAAETSRPSDVTSFLKGWSDLVQLCGGVVEP